MTLDSGNVGIGTATPLQTLDVNGRIHVNNGVIQRGGTAITATQDLGLYSQVDGNYIRLVTQNAPLRFYTDGGIGTTTRMSIEANGNVGIGTTSPSAKLTIQTPDDYDGNTIRFESQSEPSFYYLNLNTSVTGGVVRWVFDQKNNTTTYVNVLAFDRGQIGIGTANPGAKLQVQIDGATTTASLKLEHNGSNLIVRPASAGGSSSIVENTAGGSLYINPNGGNVAIATASPTENSKLEIAGTSGNVFSAGIPLVSGSGTTQTRTKSEANIDLSGHVQLKEYGNSNVAFLQARDDRVNRDISLRIRTQKAGTSQREITEAMTIEPDGDVSILGRLSCGTKPIEMTKYTDIGDNTNYQTGYSTSDWICSIAGFYSGVGDINESGSGPIIRVYTYPHGNGFWHIRADFFTHEKSENWTIWLMAIRRDIARATNDL
jgi:hypothetical protein